MKKKQKRPAQPHGLDEPELAMERDRLGHGHVVIAGDTMLADEPETRP
jgi:hypothetical protein